MTSYQYRKSHCGDKTILRPSYLHNGISYTGKTTSLYWIGAQTSQRMWILGTIPSRYFPCNFSYFLMPQKRCSQNVWPLIEVHQVLISLNMWLCISLQWRHNERDGVSNHRCLHCLFNCWFWWRSKKTSKIRVTGLCAGNSPVTGEFPAQKISNVEDVSIWWRHHGGDVAIYYKIWSMGDVAVSFYEYFGTLTRSWLVVWEFAVQLPSDKCKSTWSINIRLGNGLVPVRDQCCQRPTMSYGVTRYSLTKRLFTWTKSS